MSGDTEKNFACTPMPGGRVGLAILTLILVFMACLTPIGLHEDIAKLRFVNSLPIAVSIKSNSIPMMVCLPTIFAFCWAAVKRWRNTYTVANANQFIKIAVINFPFLIASMVGSKWYISNYMADHGYQYCYSYTGSGLYATKVWTRGADFCIKDGSIVSTDLVRWAEEQAKQRNNPSVAQVRQKINTLLDEAKL